LNLRNYQKVVDKRAAVSAVAEKNMFWKAPMVKLSLNS